LERALTAIQTRHIHDTLRRATIRSASIQGIGWPVKLRLYALGVWAAADLSAEKIKTIGGLNDDELLSLVTWRVECERQARRTAPHALPRDLHAAIGAKYARTRDAIDAEKRAALASWHADDAAIAAEYAEVRADVERKEADARAEFDASMDALDAELTALKAELPPLEAALHEIHTALYPYRTLTLGGYLKSMYLSQRQ
jgi:DNA-binding helix-hairpin-helix protein with protein kinase domain